LHDPDREVRAGTPTPGYEVARRAEIIAAELSRDEDLHRGEVRAYDRRVIDQVHDPRMVDWLEEAWAECRPFSEHHEIIPDVYRHVGLSVPGTAGREPLQKPMARLGFDSFDSMMPIVEGTYEASRSAVDVALSALDHALETGGVAYGLCRPPGHHAAAAMIGGYCYFNNAAVTAAEMARRLGGPVAIVDVDYHHGNGTQSIFYDRDDVFYASLHGAPARAFPYYLGYRDESGQGAGHGWNHNVELERAVADEEYLYLLARVIEVVHAKNVVGVVISLGVDTYMNDPISDLALSKAAYFPAGRLFRELALPTVVVQEGGYDQVDLGGQRALVPTRRRRPRRSGPGLGREPLAAPDGTIGPVDDAVVQSVLTMLPELEVIRGEEGPAPVFGTGHHRTLKLLLEGGQAFLEDIAARQDAALGAGVGADLVPPRARGEVGVGHRGVHVTHFTLDAYLSPEWFAVPEQGTVGILVEVVALVREVIGIPAKPVLAHVAKKDHAPTGTRPSVGAHECNRLALAHLILGFVEPAPKLREGILVGVGHVQGYPAFAHETSLRGQLGRADREKSLGPPCANR
jgi:acetoin utilization deacetylase AcuC-like enzyme